MEGSSRWAEKELGRAWVSGSGSFLYRRFEAGSGCLNETQRAAVIKGPDCPGEMRGAGEGEGGVCPRRPGLHNLERASQEQGAPIQITGPGTASGTLPQHSTLVTEFTVMHVYGTGTFFPPSFASHFCQRTSVASL